MDARAHKRRSPRFLSIEETAAIVPLYEAGNSSNAIARVTGHDGRVIRRALKRLGKSRSFAEAMALSRKRGETPKPPRRDGRVMAPEVHARDDFFMTWTPASAWVLGLIYGDGHVRPKGTLVKLLGSEQVCRDVARVIGHDRGPKKYGSANCWVLNFYSRPLAEDLRTRFALGGNKARRIIMPKLPAEMLGHFLRGLWDADGHWGVRGNCVLAKLASASEAMVDDVRAIVGGHKSEHRHVLRGIPRLSWVLQLRAQETREFRKLIYAASDGLRCERKRARAMTGVANA